MKKIVSQGICLLIGIGYFVASFTSNNDVYFIASQVWLTSSILIGELQ